MSTPVTWTSWYMYVYTCMLCIYMTSYVQYMQAVLPCWVRGCGHADKEYYGGTVLVHVQYMWANLDFQKC